MKQCDWLRVKDIPCKIEKNNVLANVWHIIRFFITRILLIFKLYQRPKLSHARYAD